MEWTFSDSVRLSLLSFSEASKACAALPGFSLFRRSLQPERIEYCRAELLPDCLVGSLAVPDKTHPLHLAFSLAFYLDRGQLILADTSGFAEPPLPGRTARYFRCLPPVFLVSGIADPGGYALSAEF